MTIVLIKDEVGGDVALTAAIEVSSRAITQLALDDELMEEALVVLSVLSGRVIAELELVRRMGR